MNKNSGAKSRQESAKAREQEPQGSGKEKEQSESIPLSPAPSFFLACLALLTNYECFIFLLIFLFLSLFCDLIQFSGGSSPSGKSGAVSSGPWNKGEAHRQK